MKPTNSSLFVIWIFGFFVFTLLTETLLHAFGLLEIAPWNHSLFPSIIRITGAVVLAPVAEEMIFRGLLLNKLLGMSLGKYFAIAIQALPFVFLHSFAYENTISSNIGIAQTLLDACLFAIARLLTRSLYTSIGMHVTGNLVATLERFVM